MEKKVQDFQTHSNWLPFFLFLLFIYRKDTNKLKFQEINLNDLDKKSKLLNRIRGYMDPQEQYIVHSAEIILQIIAKIKTLIDLPRIEASEIRYSALSLEDKKRNMLIDLSEFLEDEERMLVHQAVDFDVKVKTLEKKLNELHKLSQEEDFIANIHNYIEILEPVLADGTKENAVEFKKLALILKIIDSLKNKEKTDESDIMKIVQPLVNKG